MKYRKKPVVIEAVQWDGSNTAEVADFMGGGLTFGETPDGRFATVCIPTLEGVMQANPGDYIIKGVKGEFYPCKAEIFWATYEIA